MTERRRNPETQPIEPLSDAVVAFALLAVALLLVACVAVALEALL